MTEEFRDALCPPCMNEHWYKGEGDIKGGRGQGEIKKFTKKQKKDALKKTEKEATIFQLTMMEEFVVCRKCSSPAKKKSATGDCRTLHFFFVKIQLTTLQTLSTPASDPPLKSTLME